MQKAQRCQELMGVMDGGVVETKSEKERVIQSFKMSSKLWVCHPIHKWKSMNAEWDLQ